MIYLVESAIKHMFEISWLGSGSSRMDSAIH